MLLIYPQFYPITTVKPWNCFEVTIGLMLKSLGIFLPLQKTELGGCLYLSNDWVG
jgi:hypothetical protein